MNRIKNLIEKIKFVLNRKFLKIKNVVNKTPYTESQKRVFDEIHPGELIYAEMPLGDAALYDVPEGHRVRPYVVVRKEKDRLICYPSSHKKGNYKNKFREFAFKKSRNDTRFKGGRKVATEQDSYIDLYKVSEIKIEKLISIFMHPKEGESERLERQLTILKNQGKGAYTMDIAFPLKEGDLVILGPYKYGFIYSTHKDDIFAHPAYKKVKKFEMDNFVKAYYGTYYYFVDTKTQIKLNKENSRHLINSMDYSEFSKFIQDKKSLKYEEKKEKGNKIKNSIEKIKFVKLKYKIGQIFYDSYGDEKLVFLLNLENKCYGVNLKEFKEEFYQIRRLKNLDALEKGEILEKIHIENMVKKLLPVDNPKIIPTVARIMKIQI